MMASRIAVNKNTRMSGGPKESLHRVGGDHAIFIQDDSYPPRHRFALTIANSSADISDTPTQIDGVDRSALVDLFRGPFPRLGAIVCAIDRFQRPRHSAIKNAMFARSGRIIASVSFEVIEPMPFSPAAGKQQTGGRKISLVAKVTEQPMNEFAFAGIYNGFITHERRGFHRRQVPTHLLVDRRSGERIDRDQCRQRQTAPGGLRGFRSTIGHRLVHRCGLFQDERS